ncbi:hypothetical protein AXK11_00130 [Cephaloticoccus primus]|uniref:DUF1684 domain-containing protein n=1 Tax=Cephaloticoccus primus TaxID=1548207 RepID=A0A139STE9_9BACT|nr:hypothetical protein AXK11_00130 [Cephaloticoccus primus]
MPQAAALPASPEYAAELAEWRAQRLARLTAPDGWLSLIGLHFLRAGEQRVGSAPDNDIVLAAGPPSLGVIEQQPSGRVMLRVTPGAAVQVDGREVLSAELVPQGRGPRGQMSTVSSGTMRFYVIVRGEQMALRVQDSAAPRRTEFAGIKTFPIDESWRVEAQWLTFARPREVVITNTLGQESVALVLGKAVFERAGQRFELLPLQETFGEPLFFIIADETSGCETYGAARFVYADPPAEERAGAGGRIVIDFNKAINPPCAFTPFATCPLPPAENVLPVAIRAGERI